MKPEEVIWPIQSHTAAKHALLRRYLQAWLPKLGRVPGRRLLLIDGFAGPGVYTGGEPGSPIVMLQAFLDHRARSQICAELSYVFIEKEPERLNRLRAEVAKLDLPKRVSVSFLLGSFEQQMGYLLDAIPEGLGLAPTFAFIDPFGYTEHQLQLSSRILQYPRCEVLIYVPLPFIARFVTQDAMAPALNNLFGDDSWRAAREGADGRERERILHDVFLAKLRQMAGYARSFEVDASGGWSGYHLFFGTRSKIGLAAMKDAMWTVDPGTGSRFADSTNSGQLVLFEAAPDLGPLIDGLKRRFDDRPFSIEEAEDYTLLETAYSPARHLKTRTLRPAEAAGELSATLAGRRRQAGTYPAGTALQFTERAKAPAG